MWFILLQTVAMLATAVKIVIVVLSVLAADIELTSAAVAAATIGSTVASDNRVVVDTSPAAAGPNDRHWFVESDSVTHIRVDEQGWNQCSNYTGYHR